jgi:pimeloyl-ACP methyl ester carboxylesterase
VSSPAGSAMSATYREFTYASPDGLSLFCREYSGPAPRGTVVCLPGLTRNSRDFVAVANRLAPRYRVLTPDLRGRGNSPWDPKHANYHPTVYYQDIVKLLTDEVRGRAAIIGTSLGGILAMSLAAYAPDRIAGIVVNDVGPELAPEGIARISSYVGVRPTPGSWSEAAEQAKANYANAYPDFNDADWLAYAKAFYREREDGTVVADYDPALGDALRATAGRTFDMWSVWAAIKVPVLLVRGARSDLLSVATYDRMAKEMPGLVRFEVPHRGHVPQLTEAGLPEAIDEFLAGIFA